MFAPRPRLGGAAFGGRVRECVLGGVVVVALAACGLSDQDQRTADAFRDTWTLRRDGFQAELLLAEAALRRRGQRVDETLTSPEGRSWPVIARASQELMAGVAQTFTVAGREEVLGRFIARMEAEPSPAGARRWLAWEIEELSETSVRVTDRGQRLISGLGKPAVVVEQLLAEMRAFAAEQGRLIGWAREIQALFTSATAYYASLSEGTAGALYEREDARDLAALALVGEIERRHLLLRQRLELALERPRDCDDGGSRRVCALRTRIEPG